MATARWQATAPNWGDSSWRTYITDLNTRITGIGLTQTADTGQMPFSTFTPSSLTQSQTGYFLQGYLMYAFTDAQQGSLPVFIKFAFYKCRTGAQNTSVLYPTYFAVTCQVGTSTDGAGNIMVGESPSSYYRTNDSSNQTLTNPNPATFPEVFTPFQQNQGYDSLLCWDSSKGYFFFLSMPGLNSVTTVPYVTSTTLNNGCAAFVHIQRSVNSSYVPTSEYIVSTASLVNIGAAALNVNRMANGSDAPLYQTTMTQYTTISQQTTMPTIPTSSYIVNNQVQLQRTYLLAPNTRLDTSPWLYSIPVGLAQQNQQMTITLPDSTTLPVIVMSGQSPTSTQYTVPGFYNPSNVSYSFVTYFG